MNRLQEKYNNEVVPALMKHFSFKNIHQCPKLEKISINMGVGEATQNKAILDNAVKDLTQIAGKKPVVTKSTKAISNFKLREDIPIGCKVTLRGEVMYEFLDRLIAIVLPRVRDFRGVNPKSFDGRGNFTMGLTDQTVFPEIEFDKTDAIRGMDISIVTTADVDETGRELLSLFGMPFKKS